MKKQNLMTLGILFTAATGVIHIMNKMTEASAITNNKLSSQKGNYYHWRFGNIYYEKEGNGTPILLIHDLTPGSSSYEWHKIRKTLAKNYTVYTIDLLGCGRSYKPKITYTNFLYVQLLCDFIKQIIKEKTNVIVNGFSGSFTIMACHNEGELFQKLMLIHPPSLDTLNQPPIKRKKPLKMLLESPIFGTLLYHMLTGKETIGNTFMENYFYNPFQVNADFIDTYYESSHKDSCSAKFLYASICTNYLNLNINHGIKSIDHSIMLIKGEKDKNSDGIFQDYLQLNPSIETVELSASNCIPHMEVPEQLLEQVEIFFQ